jgi:hypothetical protein
MPLIQNLSVHYGRWIGLQLRSFARSPSDAAQAAVRRTPIIRNGSDQVTHVIDVEMEGQATLRAADDEDLDRYPENDRRHRPVMRPKLIVVDTMMEGHKEVRLADCSREQKPEIQISPRRSSRGLIWSHRFTLKQSELLSATELEAEGIGRRTFRVVLDEVDLRRPTSEGDTAQLIPSGPRFAAAVDVPELEGG